MSCWSGARCIARIHAHRAIAGAILVTGFSAFVNAQTVEPRCLPVAGNSLWTANEIETNRTRIAYHERVVGEKFTAPVYANYRRKYDDCVAWMRDSESKVMYDLLGQYESMQGMRSLVVEPLEVGLDLVLSPLGPYGAPIKKRALQGTQEMLFGKDASAEIEDIAAARVVDLQKKFPNDSLTQIMNRLKAELARTGQDLGGLEDSTTNWLDDIAHKVLLKRLMNEERPFATNAQQSQQRLTAKVRQFEQGAKQQKTSVAQLKAQAELAAKSLQQGTLPPPLEVLLRTGTV